jgi:hypothetical protein
MDINTASNAGVEEPESPEKPKAPGGPVVKELSKTLAEKHISIIANRARNVERKHKKMKSNRMSHRLYRYQNWAGFLYFREGREIL